MQLRRVIVFNLIIHINQNRKKQMKSIYCILITILLLIPINVSAQRIKFGSNNNYVAPPSPPVILTTAATAITGTSATNGGTVTSDGGAAVTSRGLVWGTSPGSTTFSTTNGAGIGALSTNLTGLSMATTYYVRAYATNSIGTSYGNQISFTTLATTSLKLHYDTNNSSSYPGTGTTLTDLSGNGNHGTIMNSPSFSTLTVGGGVLAFNGNQQYISTNYTPSNTSSISIWFYNTSNYTDNNRGIFSTYNGSCGCNGFYMGTLSNSFNLSRDNNVGYGNTVLPSLSINTWYNVTVTSDPSGSGTIKVYLNGSLQTTITGKTTHADVLNIGRTRFDANYWKGYIAKTMVYNAVLTGTEVLNDYNSQKTTFGY